MMIRLLNFATASFVFGSVALVLFFYIWTLACFLTWQTLPFSWGVVRLSYAIGMVSGAIIALGDKGDEW